MAFNTLLVLTTLCFVQICTAQNEKPGEVLTLSPLKGQMSKLLENEKHMACFQAMRPPYYYAVKNFTEELENIAEIVKPFLSFIDDRKNYVEEMYKTMEQYPVVMVDNIRLKKDINKAKKHMNETKNKINALNDKFRKQIQALKNQRVSGTEITLFEKNYNEAFEKAKSKIQEEMETFRRCIRGSKKQ